VEGGPRGVAPRPRAWAQRDAYTIDNLEDYIGPKRWSRLYPAGDLLRAGAYLAGGSAWNVDPLNPWRYVEQAVTRTGVPGDDAYRGRLGPRQAIGLRAAIAMNTLHAARQLRLQRETGWLTVGKQADLLVLDRNLLRIPVKRIHATRVLLTMLGGRVVHRARGL
jgi:predicted amidohydrolase YtcJ